MQKKKLLGKLRLKVLEKKEFYIDLKIGEFQDKDTGVVQFQ